MNRLLVAAVAGFVLAGAAAADIAPPKGLKRVTLDHKITTEKEFPDYAFFTIVSGGKGAKVTAVKLDPKNPLTIAGAGRGGASRQCSLVAVPKDAEKQYGGEKEFHAAIAEKKVEGMLRSKIFFDSITAIKETDARTTVTEEYKLEKIDPKEGLVVTHAKADEKKEPAGSPPPKPNEEEEGVTAYTPRGGVWVAAVAATAGLVFGGFWLAGRRRREG